MSLARMPVLLVALGFVCICAASGDARAEADAQVEYVGFEPALASWVLCQRDSINACRGADTVGLSFALGVRFGTHYWENVYWTPVELGAGAHLTMDVVHGYVGTQFGMAVKTPTNRLTIGMGIAVGKVTGVGDYNDAAADNQTPFKLMPTIRYSANVVGAWSLGIGARAILGLTPTDGGVFLLFADISAWRSQR